MTEKRGRKKINASLFAFLLLPLVTYAQTDSEVGAGIEFNFLNPGARSLGMGGAFLAVADDATAAFTNPAGIALLGKPEVSLEGRRFQFTQIFLDAGRTFGSFATGVGVDTVDFLQNGEAESSTSGLSFLSFVYPGDSWALAVYRRQAANFEANFEAQGAFIQDLGELGDTSDDGSPSRILPYRAQLDLEMVDVGVSLAARMGSIYAGVGASFYEFRLQSRSRRYRLFSDGIVGCSETEALAGGFCGPPLFEDGNVLNLQTMTGDSRDVGVNLGVLWKISDRANFAAVYRQGPTFDLHTTKETRFGVAEDSTRFHVPDVFGLGLAFYPLDAMSISFDYERVQYAQMTQDFLVLFPAADVHPDEFQVPNGNEFHLGFEYGLLRLRYPLVLRLGVWIDPDHKLRYEGRNTLNRALFQGGSDALHYAGGAGVVFGERFQIDAAYDYSSPIRTVSLSMVLRF